MANTKSTTTEKVSAHLDAELTDEQVTQLHETLLKERDRVQKGLERHIAEAVQDVDRLADDVDLASRHSEQAYLMRFADKERKLLREIDHALVKLRAGTYGVCEGSMEPIGFARLTLRPWTRYSIEYKEQLERQRRDHRRR